MLIIIKGVVLFSVVVVEIARLQLNDEYAVEIKA